MKKSDIAMIVLIASLSIMIAYFAGNAVMGGARNVAVKVQKASPIATSVEQPSKDVFNDNAINPTVQVTIGGNGQPQLTN